MAFVRRSTVLSHQEHLGRLKIPSTMTCEIAWFGYWVEYVVRSEMKAPDHAYFYKYK